MGSHDLQSSSLPRTLTARGGGSPAAEPGGGGELPFATWGRLQLRCWIGEGGFARVYQAFDPVLEIDVALKLQLDSDSGEALDESRPLREARRMARVRHPNVIRVYGAEKHNNRAGLWMDLVEGRTLEKLLEQGPFGAHEAVGIGIDLCRALAAVHGAGLVHRDVKTMNAMREPGGRIVLMDFGLVRGLQPRSDLSSDGKPAGTPAFMAPEQFLGEIATPRTDIYGLGVLLYRLVSRHCPVEAATLPELHHKVLNGETVPLTDRRPDLPLRFVEVVQRALKRDPDHRYQSMGAMERALADCLRDEDAKSQPPPPAPKWWNAKRTRAARAVMAALGALAVLAIIGYQLRERERRVGTGETAAKHVAANELGGARVAPLAATATIYRAREGGPPETLLPGSRIAPGDQLYLNIQGTHRMSVYVLNGDRRGDVFVLFPVPGFLPQNPLEPEVRHRLLQDQNWTVTSAGGEENILVIASKSPLKDLEGEIAAFPRALPGRPVTYGRLSPQTLMTLRGLGGMSPASRANHGNLDLLSHVRSSLVSQAAQTGDLWVWHLALENPGR